MFVCFGLKCDGFDFIFGFWCGVFGFFIMYFVVIENFVDRWVGIGGYFDEV